MAVNDFPPGHPARHSRWGSFPACLAEFMLHASERSCPHGRRKRQSRAGHREIQAHHLDLEFYDRFYKPGAYLRTHAKHMENWHGSSPL